MSKPPRDPKLPIANRKAVVQWFLYGVLQFVVTLIALLFAPGELSSTEANVPMTMAFVVLSFASIFAGLVMRRDPESGLSAPVLGALKILSVPAIITVLAVELGFLQAFLMTTSLTGGQWLACLALAVIVPVVVELEKVVRRRRKAAGAEPIPAVAAVAPERARV